MPKVERAIVLAAGMGKRLQPLTFDMPKPLIKVNGKRMIDTIIDGLHRNGIEEIYIVVGYLKEKFNVLKAEYPDITLIENPYYKTCNNISSLFVAREYIKSAIILDGDQIINNPDVLSPNFERSGYNAIWTDEHTDEWLLSVKSEMVISCSRTGGEHGWQLFSISRWTEEDGEKLKRHLETEFTGNRNTQIYWDDIALFLYPEEYSLGIKEMKQGDVWEIDSMEELVKVDAEYSKYER